jgi:hypothetical protein
MIEIAIGRNPAKHMCQKELKSDLTLLSKKRLVVDQQPNRQRQQTSKKIRAGISQIRKKKGPRFSRALCDLIPIVIN